MQPLIGIDINKENKSCNLRDYSVMLFVSKGEASHPSTLEPVFTPFSRKREAKRIKTLWRLSHYTKLETTGRVGA